MACATRMALACAAGLLSLSGDAAIVGAAHEWRADWASLQPLNLVDEQLLCRAERPRLLLAVARPYDLSELRYQRIVARAGSWEAHCGTLSGPFYREGHLGCGRTFRLTDGVEALAGVRLFSVAVEGWSSEACGAATLVGRLQPAGMAPIAVEAGLVDFAFSRASSAPAPILVARFQARVDPRYRLLIERSVSPRAAAETTLAFLLRGSCLSVGQALRCGTGEAALSLGCRAHGAEIVVAERWHPQLGWTTECSLRWHARKAAPDAG